jgi:hypothetical protein
MPRRARDGGPVWSRAAMTRFTGNPCAVKARTGLAAYGRDGITGVSRQVLTRERKREYGQL